MSNNFTYSINRPGSQTHALDFHSGQQPQPGQIIRLSGPNGAGKTTLLQLLSSLIRPSEGQSPYTSDDLFYLPHHAGMRGQLTVWENLDYWAALFNINAKHYAKEILEITDIFELNSLLHVSLYLLSAGQQRRAALLRLALVQSKKLWLLDEPETSLDQATIQKLGHIVTAYADKGGSVIWASHQDLPTRTDGEIIL
ncbi:MAG TPA: heme ABC exporter ATP-binding protein CcmA [Alphaproteobacteria bacterium]